MLYILKACFYQSPSRKLVIDMKKKIKINLRGCIIYVLIKGLKRGFEKRVRYTHSELAGRGLSKM